jgi:hypothetical protein
LPGKESAMTRVLAMLLLALSLAAPVRAQEPSPETLAAARDLSAIMTGDTIAQMTAAMAAQIWPAIAQQLGAKVDAPTLTEMRAEFERTLKSFTGDVMKDAPEVYARHFSAQELRDMVAFYKSPSGAKALHEMPKVMADVGARMGPRVQALQSDLDQRMRAILQKHGYKD